MYNLASIIVQFDYLINSVKLFMQLRLYRNVAHNLTHAFEAFTLMLVLEICGLGIDHVGLCIVLETNWIGLDTAGLIPITAFHKVVYRWHV